MKMLPLAAMAALAACSVNQPADNSSNAVANDAVALPEPGNTTATVPELQPQPQVLKLEGLGDLMIGQAIPSGSRWAERGAQASDTCRIVSSPDYPGAYAIVEGGKVRRITIGDKSTVKLAEGIGVGATEGDVRKWFAGFKSEPHEYEAAPAKYLTAPNAPSGESALRFEIGADSKVSLVHVGTMPVLGYVEGCA